MRREGKRDLDRVMEELRGRENYESAVTFVMSV